MHAYVIDATLCAWIALLFLIWARWIVTRWRFLLWRSRSKEEILRVPVTGLVASAVLLGYAAVGARAYSQATPTLQTASVPAAGGGEADGLIKLDVVVTDGAGRPVAGLAPMDFTLLDDGQPQQIRTFQTLGRTDPNVEVILLIDTLDMPETLGMAGACGGRRVLAAEWRESDTPAVSLRALLRWPGGDSAVFERRERVGQGRRSQPRAYTSQCNAAVQNRIFFRTTV